MYLSEDTFKHYISLFRRAEQSPNWKGQLEADSSDAKMIYFNNAEQDDGVIINKLIALDNQLDFAIAHQNTDGGEFDE